MCDATKLKATRGSTGSSVQMDRPDHSYANFRLSRPSSQPDPNQFYGHHNVDVPQYYAPVGDASVPVVSATAPHLNDSDDENSGFVQIEFPHNPVAIGYNFLPYSEILTQREHNVNGGVNEGLLFVMIFQAQSLTPPGDKDVSCLVRCSLKGMTKRPLVGDTKLVKKNSHLPKFFSQFLFPVNLDFTPSLELDVMQKKIFGYAPLGSLHLDVGRIGNEPTSRRIYPLDLNNGRSNGKIEVLTGFTRMILTEEQKEKVKEFESLRLVLERHIYFAGELVRGVVYYTVRGTEKKIHWLKLKSEGQIKYHSSHQETYHDKDGHRRTRTVHDYEERQVFKTKVRLLGQEGKGKQPITLPVGENVFPFEFWLPPQVPATGSAECGPCGVTVKYNVSAVVDIAKALHKDKRQNVPFNVILRYPSPIPRLAETSMTFAFRKDSPVRMRAWMAEQQLFPGLESKVFVEIQNSSNKEIRKCKLSVVANVSAVARGHHKSGTLTLLTTKGDFVPVLPGQTKRVEFDFTIPYKSCCTMTLPQANVAWFVRCTLKYGLKSSHAIIPVVLHPPCPEFLSDFPVVPVFETTPRVEVAIGISTEDARKYPWWSFIQ